MARFDGFVLLSEMRTGSNFLEETLNLFPGLQCHGEAFNPAFVGQHDRQELFGLGRAARDTDPLELARRIFGQSDELGGFRIFHDHAPEVLEALLPDPRIAKILLTRNPLDAFVSLKIAQATKQWRLTDERHRKSARIRFVPAEFEAYQHDIRSHQAKVHRILQTTGQAAFPISYEQIGDVEVINGLARFLGIDHRLEAVSARLKRQNPGALRDKVENYAEMQTTLAETGLTGSDEAAHVEPRHDASLPTFVAAAQAPLLFMPVKGGPTGRVERWLASVDAADQGGLQRGFTRKSLRQWKNRNKEARAFTVVAHPVERAHRVFTHHVLATGPGSFARIRRALRADYGLPIPETPTEDALPHEDRRTAFLGFLHFLKKNLAGQTPLRTDPAFSSQSALLEAMSGVLAPDMVLRETQLDLGLEQLCQQIGIAAPPTPSADGQARAALAEMHDDEIEAAARAAYNRDYMAFGFRGWAG